MLCKIIILHYLNTYVRDLNLGFEVINLSDTIRIKDKE